jgi:hypothetical protein
MTKIGEVVGVGVFNFNDSIIRKLINKHFIKTESCNYVDKEGKLILKEHENIENVVIAQNNVCSNVKMEVVADVFDNGKLSNFRIKGR